MRNEIRTLVYLQNSGTFIGSVFNSVILSCKGKESQIENIIKHASNFIERIHTIKPINWKEIADNNIDFYKNTEGKEIVDKVNELCTIIGYTQFQGPHLYGGKTKEKFYQEPKLIMNFEMNIKSKNISTIMSICKFEGKHICNIQLVKSNINDLKNYQHTITDMLIKREIMYWKSTSHEKKNIILQHLSQLKENKYE